MPQHVLHRPREFGRWFHSARDLHVHWFEYSVSLGYAVGSSVFFIGSYLFCESLGAWELIGKEAAKHIGETLFWVGCTVFLGLTCLDVLEAMLAKAPTGEICERQLFFWGSLVFEVGTILHTEEVVQALDPPGPDEPFDKACPVWGTALFIIGSFVFSFASFVNALDRNVKVHSRRFTKLSVAACCAYEAGGLLFITGSVAYLGPDVMDCGPFLIELGNICYLAGAAAYLLGDTLSFLILRVIDESATNILSGKISLQDAQEMGCPHCTGYELAGNGSAAKDELVGSSDGSEDEPGGSSDEAEDGSPSCNGAC